MYEREVYDAIVNGDAGSLEKYISNGADPNFAALQATVLDRAWLLPMLVSLGADETSLVETKNPELILQVTPSPEKLYDYIFRPLDEDTITYLVKSCKDLTPCMKRAISRGDVTVMNIMREHDRFDVSVCLGEAIRTGNASMAEWLVSRGADIERGLLMAASIGNAAMVKFFVEKGAKPSFDAMQIMHFTTNSN